MTTDTPSSAVSEQTNRYLDTTVLWESAQAVAVGLQLTGGLFSSILSVAAMCLTVSAVFVQDATVHPAASAVACVVLGCIGYVSTTGAVTATNES